MLSETRARLAFIVSHPIQYYAPLHKALAKRNDVEIKVFFTWHAGGTSILDRGFNTSFSWDIPLTDGYEYESVPNIATDPGTHHFWGLRNPSLVACVNAWRPDAVHLTGYAYESHLRAMRAFGRAGIPVLFRGDSHLLDGEGDLKGRLKRVALGAIYRLPAIFLYVGQANRDYYRAYGVPEAKLRYCPHSIEVSRFAEPASEWEAEALRWRRELGIRDDQKTLLFAGKFERKKQPLELMKAFGNAGLEDVILLMVGDGEFSAEVRAQAERAPDRIRVLPFQNQSRMPVVYRLGDVLVLPSAYGETWGLAVNEALACGRPALVSDRVGCAADVVLPGETGEIFHVGDWRDFVPKLHDCLTLTAPSHRQTLIRFARRFDIAETERYLMTALHDTLDAQGKYA